MQQYILSKKNVITVISGLLIVLGFFSHFVLEKRRTFRVVFDHRLCLWDYANCDSSVSSNESQSHQY